LVKRFSPDIADIASRARLLVFSVLPEAYEIVWTRQKTVGYGTGPKKMTEHFCWIAPATQHVTLGFNYGAELPDPAGLLEGTGKLFRHVKLASAADADSAALRRLLVAATKHRVPPPVSVPRS
jgi:hypothetical protein